MKRRASGFITGVGSLLAIMPGTDYAQFIPKQSASERMRSHWEKAGQHLRTGIQQYEHEQKS